MNLVVFFVHQIGNAFVDVPTNMEGTYEFQWGHALISDESYSKIREKCNFSAPNNECFDAESEIDIGSIDWYNIYAPNCRSAENRETKPDDGVRNQLLTVPFPRTSFKY